MWSDLARGKENGKAVVIVPGKVSRRPWSTREEKVLADMMQRGVKQKHIAETLGRSVASVSNHWIGMRERGLVSRSLPKNKPWTPSELTFLKESCGKKSWVDLAQEMDRSVNSVRSKAYRLGYVEKTQSALQKRLTGEEKRVIEQCMGSVPTRKIAGELGRQHFTVLNYCVRLGVEEGSVGRRWVEEDLEELITLRREGATLEEIAATVGRTLGSVTGKLRQLEEDRHLNR